MEGKEVLPNEESEVSDSNVVTPGTEFMYELSKQLQTYIRLRIANHPAWKQLKVRFHLKRFKNLFNEIVFC